MIVIPCDVILNEYFWKLPWEKNNICFYIAIENIILLYCYYCARKINIYWSWLLRNLVYCILSNIFNISPYFLVLYIRGCIHYFCMLIDLTNLLSKRNFFLFHCLAINKKTKINIESTMKTNRHFTLCRNACLFYSISTIATIFLM